MSTHLVLDGVDDIRRRRLEAHWSKKGPRLEKLPAPSPEALRETRPHRSLHERADELQPDGPPREDEELWWAELLGQEEVVGLEDLIPDTEGTEPWRRLEAEEQRDRLLALIAGLPHARRQALLLHAMEGYATDEIAMLQDRPEDEVKADIESARKWLKGRLVDEGLAVEDAGKPAAPAGGLKTVATW